MKVKDLRAVIDGVDGEMHLVTSSAVSNQMIFAGANIEERIIGEHPKNGLEVYSYPPSEYDRYLEGKGALARYAQLEGVIRVRLEKCVVIA